MKHLVLAFAVLIGGATSLQAQTGSPSSYLLRSSKPPVQQVQSRCGINYWRCSDSNGSGGGVCCHFDERCTYYGNGYAQCIPGR